MYKKETDLQQSYAVVSGLHMMVDSDIQYKWYTQEQISPEVQSKVQEGVNTADQFLFWPIQFALLRLMKQFEHKGTLPSPSRRGLLLNARDAVHPEVRQIITSVRNGVTRIRPSLSMAVEGSLPTAQAVIDLNILGPSTTLANKTGGLQVVGWGANLLIEEHVDLIFVGEVLRGIESTSQFNGSVTVASLMRTNQTPCKPIGVLTDWGWGAVSQNAAKGQTLKDLLEWLSNDNTSQEFAATDRTNFAVFRVSRLLA